LDKQFRNAICDSYDFLKAPDFLALPEPWKVIVGRLLNKERAMRPHNAAQIATILRKIGGI
ncbi:unnamed protein product, partial [marine sediment metagenome]